MGRDAKSFGNAKWRGQRLDRLLPAVRLSCVGHSRRLDTRREESWRQSVRRNPCWITRLGRADAYVGP